MSSADDLRNSLMCSGTYLGDPSLPSSVRWVRQGRKYNLCTIDANDTDPVSVLLSVVVKISEDGFWLTSDASWTQPTEAAPTLADVKGTCVGVRPSEPTFSLDFVTVLDNVRRLLDDIATEGRVRRGFVPADEGNMGELKFRHVFFQARDSTEDYAADDPIRTWPTHSMAAKDALEEIIANRAHAICPLHAYDAAGRLIPPQLYHARLPGATAHIHFMLSHTSFRNYNNFTADVHSIRVIHPASPSTTPAKRVPAKAFEDPLLSLKGKRARK